MTGAAYGLALAATALLAQDPEPHLNPVEWDRLLTSHLVWQAEDGALYVTNVRDVVQSQGAATCTVQLELRHDPALAASLVHLSLVRIGCTSVREEPR